MFIHTLSHATEITALSFMLASYAGQDAELVRRPEVIAGNACAHGYHSDAGENDCTVGCGCPCHGVCHGS